MTVLVLVCLVVVLLVIVGALAWAGVVEVYIRKTTTYWTFNAPAGQTRQTDIENIPVRAYSVVFGPWIFEFQAGRWCE